MKTYFYEPRDPLALRDGRMAAEGSPMRTLQFPWPSSITGMVRTRLGQDSDGRFSLNKDEAKKLMSVPVLGPWLVEISRDDKMVQIYLPTPVDSLWHCLDTGQPSNLNRYQLTPMTVEEGCLTDLPKGLELVMPAVDLPAGKAASGPAFISWSAYSYWLMKPEKCAKWNSEHGLESLPVDTRTHVNIDENTGAAKEGNLFSTEGLTFVLHDERGSRRFALVFACDDTRLESKLGTAHLGGERRLGYLKKGDDTMVPKCVSIPSDARRLRMVLITPGVFNKGFIPSDEMLGGEGRMIAAAVGRPQGISGWDYAENRPKESKRMAPAGSVYWVELNAGVDAQKFAQKWWMQSLCDDEQSRRDGFGICLVGVN